MGPPFQDPPPPYPVTATVPLTDTGIRKAKPAAAVQKLRDGGGLYLLPRPDGAKWWRWDYRRPATSKCNTLSLGTYPDVNLATARERHATARKLLAEGIDPGEHARLRNPRLIAFLKPSK